MTEWEKTVLDRTGLFLGRVQDTLVYNRMLGGEPLEACEADQSLLYRYPLRGWQADGSADGHIRLGALMSIADSATGTFVAAASGGGTATASLNAAPAVPVFPGQTVSAAARITHLGRRLIQATCTLTCVETGETALESTSLWAKVSRERASRDFSDQTVGEPAAPEPFRFLELLGIHPEDAEEGFYTYRADLQDWQKNGRGEIHGGVMVSLLLESSGQAVKTAAKTAPSFIADEMEAGSGAELRSLSASVNYIRPGIPGRRVRAEVRLSRSGGVWTARAALIDAEGGKTLLDLLSVWA